MSKPTNVGRWRRSLVLHVCTSCRGAGESRDYPPGTKLFAELRDAFREHPNAASVEVRPAECLSVCPRPCGIALSSPGSWTYLFGDQRPAVTVQDIVDCVALYARSIDGHMSRDQRPKSLRTSILGRIPAIRRAD